MMVGAGRGEAFGSWQSRQQSSKEREAEIYAQRLARLNEILAEKAERSAPKDRTAPPSFLGPFCAASPPGS
jgi:hypothetical protein